MKNRKLLLIVSLVLALTMSLGGTLAYLQDSDADVNTMVLGNVKIVQNEQERVEIGNAAAGLQAFTDGQMMMPAVYELVDADGNKIADPAREEVDVNGYKITYGGGMRTFPNYMDKIVTVTNTGNSDAWVRTLIAVPVAPNESDADNNVSEQWLHYNCVSDTDTTPANGWYYGKNKAAGEYPKDYADHYIVKNVTINGAVYDVTVTTNVNPVEPGETTGPNLVGLYLDNDVDYKDGKYYGKSATDGKPVVVWEKPELNVLVLTQAVQAAGFDDPFVAFTNSFGDVTDEAAEEWFGELYKADGSINQDMIGSPSNDGVNDKNDTNNPPLFFEGDPAELAKMLAENTDAMSGDVIIELTENYDMSNYDWKPISVDGYHGAGVITIEGNGNTIKGLKAPLFAGGFAGSSGIVIKNLTIADSTMTAPTSQGSGAFICCVDSMPKIDLVNCHAKNVVLNGKSRTGGLIGWTSGYSNQNDGPVKTYVTIENCSVVGCTINAETESAGGIIGHSGASDWTYTTVTNCKVVDTEINGGDGKTGIYLGTSNIGETTFVDCTNDNVSGNLNEDHPEYGRTAHGTTGKLVINGTEIK